MKNNDNNESKKHGCFTPIDKLPEGASVIDPPKDVEPTSGIEGGSGADDSPKIKACEDKTEGQGCSWVYGGTTYKGRCTKKGGGSKLHCSEVAR